MITVKSAREIETMARAGRIVGDTLALTPPMGWNSWYIHYHRVTGKVMREAADVMVSSGMADFKLSDTVAVRVSGMSRGKDGYVAMLDYGQTHHAGTLACRCGASGCAGWL